MASAVNAVSLEEPLTLTLALNICKILFLIIETESC